VSERKALGGLKNELQGNIYYKECIGSRGAILYKKFWVNSSEV